MKHTLLRTTLLACSVAALLPSAAHALTANTGDLLLGFRSNNDTGTNLNITIDLGSANALFAAAVPGVPLNLNYGGSFFGTTGGLSINDLSLIFGSSWDTNTNLKWSIGGTNGAGGNNTLWVTQKAGNANPPTTAADQSTARSRFDQEKNGVASYAFGTSQSGIGGTGSLESPESAVYGSSNTNSYKQAILPTGTTQYGQFNASFGTENGVVTTGSQTANLYELVQGPGNPSTLKGTFALGSDGTLTYTAAVPEPTSALLVGLAGAGVLGLRRRRQATVA